MQVIGEGETLWFMEGSWVRSSRSHTSREPSCLAMKNTPGLLIDHWPAVNLLLFVFDSRMGPLCRQCFISCIFQSNIANKAVVFVTDNCCLFNSMWSVSGYCLRLLYKSPTSGIQAYCDTFLPYGEGPSSNTEENVSEEWRTTHAHYRPIVAGMVVVWLWS